MRKEKWDFITKQEKELYIKNIIENRNLPFIFDRIETFEQNNISLETTILKDKEYDSEFVFIPAKENVLLGWDIKKCSLGKNVEKTFYNYWQESKEYYTQEYEEIKQDYEEQIQEARNKGDLEEINELMESMGEDLEYSKKEKEISFESFWKELMQFIESSVTPLRTANINAMIVERTAYYLEKDTTYTTFIDELKQTPFTIPTEDEWEYLCGGGTRTFFRWGDSLEKELDAMFQIGTDSASDYSLLYEPNMFGLHIAHNSYMLELVDSPCKQKGGDGGCSLCGGDGAIYVAPIFSTFFNGYTSNSENLSKNFYCFRRIIRI